jgi:hypothetical protein
VKRVALRMVEIDAHCAAEGTDNNSIGYFVDRTSAFMAASGRVSLPLYLIPNDSQRSEMPPFETRRYGRLIGLVNRRELVWAVLAALRQRKRSSPNDTGVSVPGPPALQRCFTSLEGGKRARSVAYCLRRSPEGPVETATHSLPIAEPGLAGDLSDRQTPLL